MKLERKTFKKIIKTAFIIFLIISWTLTSWPGIPFINFPFKIGEAQAATVFITTGTTWTVPSDWNSANNTIEVIGGGGGGGGGKTGAGAGSGSGGGAGAYAKISNLTLTAGGSVTIQVGASGAGGAAGSNGTAGTATFFNGATCTGASVCGANGSNGLTTSATGGAGGTTANSVGTTKFAGGNGGGGSTTSGVSAGGGGGAAGLNGAGNSAAAGPSAGGSGDAGFGGAGGAAGFNGMAGGNGTEYDATHGSGGGGGGDNVVASGGVGGAGGLYGAGGGGGGGKGTGGNGNQGLIIVTYTPVATTTYTQNTYRWYQDNNALNPTTAWGTPAIAENTAIVTLPAGNAPPDPTVSLRLRVNFTIGTVNLSASSVQFKLQFKAGTDSTCTTGIWTDVGASQAWQYATSGVTDGSTIVTVLLSTSNVGGQYAKSAPTALNANAATIGQNIEYDFHVIGTLSTTVTQYSFRAVKSDGTLFGTYTNCPTLTTAPGTSNLLKHGDFFQNGAEQGFFWVN